MAEGINAQGRGTGDSGHGGDGSWTAQGSCGGSDWDSVVVCALRQWQSAAAEAGILWERRRQRLGASGLCWEGENVK